MPSPGALDQFQHDELRQVHELNRAFLALLQSRVRESRSCLGLPVAAQAPLVAAAAGCLENVATFPRALFDLHVAGPGLQPPEASADFDAAEQHLCFCLLLAARQTSRQSAYHARLLFGLTAADVERLRAAPLADLQQLASLPGVLQCALRDRVWFWPQLFTATRPELRRQLTLMALQPCLAIAWPQRRPPHSFA
jgi:hypothetical protein